MRHVLEIEYTSLAREKNATKLKEISWRMFMEVRLCITQNARIERICFVWLTTGRHSRVEFFHDMIKNVFKENIILIIL